MQLSLRAESTDPSSEDQPAQGNLSASWEIAVVVSLLVLLAGLISTVIWHSRRTRRRRMRAQLRDAASEAGRTQEKTPPSSEFSRDVSLSKPLPAASTQSLETSFNSESKPRHYWDHR
ncbi:hypothetical protein B0H17DRAFT_1325656 [Mycena rosella]|uniref:Uncharacterized protein n=1 Tax=Mycena rosella TaxID=1033263 RepID=A0AAD7GWL9_MYCRO|nr:hypothetical protein B0H17DRAFT_1325656 [Mycena rosella]